MPWIRAAKNRWYYR